MANPEQGPQQQGVVGTWQTVNLGLPDFLEPVRQAIDQFFSALIQILNILLAILEILKTFAIGFLDPIIALIEAILALIEGLLQDLRQAGLYIHGDFYILEGPEFRDLLGGFTAYERRMVTRLVDRSDPNRPNISSQSAVVAVFFYLSADLTAFERIMRFLRGILALFNRQIPLPRSLGAVTNLQATYGLDGTSVFSFTKPGFFPTRAQLQNEQLTDTFNAVNLTWQMAQTPGNFVTPFAQLPPAGFLIEVSTISQGIQVQYDKPIKGSNEGSPNNKGRDAGTCVNEDGTPITLFGGIDQLQIDPSLNFNNGTTGTGDLKALAVRVFGVKNLSDAAPIDFSALRLGDDYFLQRTFFTPSSKAGFFPGKGFGVTLLFDDMPRDAEFELSGGQTQVTELERPSKFFVRVRPVSGAITGPEDFAYQASQGLFDDAPNPVELPLFQPNGGGENQITLNDIGPLSAPLEITFPGDDTEEYLRCVLNALIVLVLSRADLPVRHATTGDPPQVVTVNFPPEDDDPGIPAGFAPNRNWAAYVGSARLFTQLEDAAALLIPQLLGRKRRIDKFYGMAEDLGKWRKRLLARCVNLSNEMYRQNRPPPTIEQVVVDTCQDLLEFSFPLIQVAEGDDLVLDEQNLIEALSSGRTEFGIAPNPMSIGLKSKRREFSSQFDGALLQREPHFFAARRGNKVKGSVDQAPVYYSLENQNQISEIAFCRNLFPDDVYEQAAFALRIAIGPFQRPQEKGWIAIRLFPQGIPAIDRFLDELLALLRSIRAALQAITDLIKRFIEFLQSRIIELQALLNRINAMIQNLLRLFIGLPAAAGLVVVANGTDGVLQSLVSAGDKPFDSPSAYGGGAVLLAGGIPTVALDLFKALIQGDG